MMQIVSPEPDNAGRGGIGRPAPIRLIVAIPIAGAALFLAIAAASTPGNFFANLFTLTIGLPITFAWGAFSGFSVAGDMLGAALQAGFVSTMTAPLVAGLLAGLAVTLVQRLRWLPGAARLKETTASTMTTSDFWSGGVFDSLRLLSINIVTAYVVAAMLSSLGMFTAADSYAATLDYVAGAGGHGGFDTLSPDSALYALFFIFGVAAIFGMTGGFSAGALIGAVFGALSWAGIGFAAAKGATKSVTVAAFAVRDPGERGNIANRLLFAAFTGGLSGALGGLFISVALCAFRLFAGLTL